MGARCVLVVVVCDVCFAVAGRGDLACGGFQGLQEWMLIPNPSCSVGSGSDAHPSPAGSGGGRGGKTRGKRGGRVSAFANHICVLFGGVLVAAPCVHVVVGCLVRPLDLLVCVAVFCRATRVAQSPRPPSSTRLTTFEMGT
jgi:hypothetical protein